MDCNFETMINNVLEKIAAGYNAARAEWKADRKNAFKDGKFLAYYEAKETVLKDLSCEDAFNDALEELARLYTRAKAEWLADRRNPFKDGRFLACFEILNMFPAA